MKRFILFFVAILLFCSVSNAISIPLGEPASPFRLKTAAGKTVSLAELNGKIVVLIYWRTEHKRSLLALKDSNELLKTLKGKNVEFVSIIADSDNKTKAKEIVTGNGIEIPVLLDQGRQVYSNYGIRVYPTTIIIDKEGTIIQDIPSHPLSYKKLLKGHVSKALGEIDEAQLNEIITPHKDKKDKATLDAERMYNLASKFTSSGLYDMAIKSAENAVEVKPDMEEALILLGFLYLETENADGAVKAFNKAISLNFHSKEAITGLGGAYVLQGDADKAIETLEPATKGNPYPQMTYYELGKAYELKGDKDSSSAMYKKAIEKIIHKQILPSSVAKCQ